jgi:hypothetical protein
MPSPKLQNREILRRNQGGVSACRLIHRDLVEAEAAACRGECNIFTFEIRVRQDLPDSHFAEVLEHEINHACWLRNSKAAPMRRRS